MATLNPLGVDTSNNQYKVYTASDVLSAPATGLATTSSIVTVNTSAAPTAGQVLVAQSASVATWSSVASGSSGGMAFVASTSGFANSATTTSRASLVSFTGINIPQRTPFMLMLPWYIDNGGADALQLSLTINGVVVSQDKQVSGGATTSDLYGVQVWTVGPRSSINSVFLGPGGYSNMANIGLTVNEHMGGFTSGLTAPVNSSITSLLVEGKLANGGTGSTGYVYNACLYTYPTS